MKPELTETDRAVLEYIRRQQRQITAGPTLRAVAEHFDAWQNTVQRSVAKLREAGELEPESGNGLVVRVPKCVKPASKRAEAKVAAMLGGTRRPLTKSGGRLL